MRRSGGVFDRERERRGGGVRRRCDADGDERRRGGGVERRGLRRGERERRGERVRLRRDGGERRELTTRSAPSRAADAATPQKRHA